MSGGPQVLLVMTTLPDPETARAVATMLVERRLAACVSVLAECTSVYRWRGTVDAAGEVPVFAKTTVERYPALAAALEEAHPYELPEIVAVPVTNGLPAYLQWVAAETREPDLPATP